MSHTINVSGRIFTVSVNVLEKCKFFKDIVVKDPYQNSHFLDRNSDSFSLVLDHLRGCELFKPSDRNLFERLIEDAEFFELEDLQLLIASWIVCVSIKTNVELDNLEKEYNLSIKNLEELGFEKLTKTEQFNIEWPIIKKAFHIEKLMKEYLRLKKLNNKRREINFFFDYVELLCLSSCFKSSPENRCKDIQDFESCFKKAKEDLVNTNLEFENVYSIGIQLILPYLMRIPKIQSLLQKIFDNINFNHMDHECRHD